MCLGFIAVVFRVLVEVCLKIRSSSREICIGILWGERRHVARQRHRLSTCSCAFFYWYSKQQLVFLMSRVSSSSSISFEAS